jgi:N-acetylglucosaminyl-diphospho-decaprenol L-rhamnosyltransferase
MALQFLLQKAEPAANCQHVEKGGAVMSSVMDVVIVTYNSSEVIGRCLASLMGAPVGQVIIFDNGSADETLAYVKSSPIAAQVTLVESKENLGFAAAVNRGVGMAKSEFVLMLNPDCEMNERFIADALYCHSMGADVVAPKAVFNGNGDMLPGIIKNPSLKELRFKWLLYSIIMPLPSRLFLLIALSAPIRFVLRRLIAFISRFRTPRWYWPNGACFSISRTVFQSAGGMPEDYFMYMEDTEFGYHLCRQGVSYAQTQQKVFHGWGKGSNIPRKARIRLVLRAYAIYLNRQRLGFPRG